MSGSSFESFYLRKVALNEGCGCAEQIIGTRDLDRAFQEAAPYRSVESDERRPLLWLQRLIRT